MRILLTVAVAATLLSGALLVAEEDFALKKSLEDGEVADGWIYEDIEAGYAEATRTGKPLLVSFRCVP